MKIFLFVLQILFAIGFMVSSYDFFTYENLRDGITALIDLIIFYEIARLCREVE